MLKPEKEKKNSSTRVEFQEKRTEHHALLSTSYTHETQRETLHPLLSMSVVSTLKGGRTSLGGEKAEVYTSCRVVLDVSANALSDIRVGAEVG